MHGQSTLSLGVIGGIWSPICSMSFVGTPVSVCTSSPGDNWELDTRKQKTKHQKLTAQCLAFTASEAGLPASFLFAIAKQLLIIGHGPTSPADFLQNSQLLYFCLLELPDSISTLGRAHKAKASLQVPGTSWHLVTEAKTDTATRKPLNDTFKSFLHSRHRRWI